MLTIHIRIRIRDTLGARDVRSLPRDDRERDEPPEAGADLEHEVDPGDVPVGDDAAGDEEGVGEEGECVDALMALLAFSIGNGDQKGVGKGGPTVHQSRPNPENCMVL